MAGLTATAVIVPRALAHTTIASLPVQGGLDATFVPMVICLAIVQHLPQSSLVTVLLSLAGQACNPPVYAGSGKCGTTVFRSLSPGHPDNEQWPGL